MAYRYPIWYTIGYISFKDLTYQLIYQTQISSISTVHSLSHLHQMSFRNCKGWNGKKKKKEKNQVLSTPTHPSKNASKAQNCILFKVAIIILNTESDHV